MSCCFWDKKERKKGKKRKKRKREKIRQTCEEQFEINLKPSDARAKVGWAVAAITMSFLRCGLVHLLSSLHFGSGAEY